MKLTLADVAFAVPIVTPDIPVAEIDLLFRSDQQLRAVIMQGGQSVSLLTRQHVEYQLSGPFGYGRSLHSRSLAGDLADGLDEPLDGSTSLTTAAEIVLARSGTHRYRDILIELTDGLAIARVSAVLEELSRNFREIALHDPLTGLPNRRLLAEQGGVISAPGAAPSRVAILYIDLDGFKLVNDTFGHLAGDQVLIDFAERLRSCVRPTDIVARVGGDEFVALLCDVSDAAAMTVADRVVVLASAPFFHEGEAVYLSASVGFAMADEISAEIGISSLDVLLRHADAAMMQAKRSGKQRVNRLGHHGRVPDVARTALIRRRLSSAVQHGDFSLHYQPQLDLENGDLTAVEALLRWTDSELGSVSPAEFIPIAEETEHIHLIGEWVLSQACRQARDWFDQGESRTVSVNLSPIQFTRGTVTRSVLGAIATARLPARLLRLEITEGAPLPDLAGTLLQLHTLQSAGIDIELDDFGIGHSSLERLLQLPLSTVKIDKLFIDDIDRDPAARALVGGMVDTAHAVGLRVTAEGVERPAQLAALRSLRCDSAQGFLIARPGPANQLAKLLPRVAG